MPRITRNSPLTWRQALEALDEAEARLQELLLLPRLTQSAKAAILQVRTEVLLPALRRAGRRPSLRDEF